MFLVFGIVILGFVTVAMAKKAPNNVGTALPPDTSLPAHGATDKFSPNLTGGNPLISQDNRIRLGTSYVYADFFVDRTRLVPASPGTISGIRGGLTDAQSSLKTQDVPPLVTRDNKNTAKSSFIQRIKL